ncbi:hypothetical protein [Streptomyces sp. AC555_RSS877]|uniref:hypothetical protein n=1 Tax=Streptomyces sp. AC555_RSS877 TaxID=2823688 RepID=UPI001C260B3F|nr:hypothetical protein [Streptomyces sp. AC555_RSS877]
MRSRILGVVVGAAVVLVPLLVFTHRISRTESTTGLDRHSMETIDGHQADGCLSQEGEFTRLTVGSAGVYRIGSSYLPSSPASSSSGAGGC